MEVWAKEDEQVEGLGALDYFLPFFKNFIAQKNQLDLFGPEILENSKINSSSIENLP